MESTNEKTTYADFDAVFTARRVATCAQQIIPFLDRAQTILDVGCGHGSIVIDMARNYAPNSTFKALDVNKSWLDIGNAEAKRQGVTNIEWMTGNASDLSRFGDDTFDIVHAHQVILHVEDPVEVLGEMRRVCRPGGIVTTRDMIQSLTIPENELLDKCSRLVNQTGPSRGTTFWGGKYNHVWAHEAGFAWDQIDMSSAGWDYSGQDKRELWWRGVKDIGNKVLNAGLITVEEKKSVDLAWEKWRADPAGRIVALDSVLICRK